MSRILPFRRVRGRPTEMSDEGLVAACATGESAALGALYDRHVDAVRRFLARMSGTDERDLDDLVQATFETVPRAARRFGGESQVRTWLFGVASNVVRHHVRSEVRRKRLVAAFAEERPGAQGDTSDEVLERERAARLQAAIAALPDKLREAFVLVYLEGVPGGEVATLLGVREGTIWKRLFQARAHLRASLGGVYP
ncbi:MAG TPA: RNA polymerase sigma factor [Kofleriaceae bacterium]|nr:RNA polymerase sigma factor [Kofleriaceae bacterium]